ncbi:ORF1 [Bactrocera dorsalis borna-like virus]|nr:ORF1 [Bactrocera dorsalis borna-like virus]
MSDELTSLQDLFGTSPLFVREPNNDNSTNYVAIDIRSTRFEIGVKMVNDEVEAINIPYAVAKVLDEVHPQLLNNVSQTQEAFNFEEDLMEAKNPVLPYTHMAKIAQALPTITNNMLQQIISYYSGLGLTESEARSNIILAHLFYLSPAFPEKYRVYTGVKVTRFLQHGTNDFPQAPSVSNQVPLYTTREGFEFGMLLAYHGLGKNYTSDNFNQVVTKRASAFYASLGLKAPPIIELPFIKSIFDEQYLSQYQGFLPVELRPYLIDGLNASRRIALRMYLSNISQYTGMSLIRACHSMLFQPELLAGFFDPNTQSEITIFINWYTEHSRQTDKFPLLWYYDPAVLEGVSHQKLSNLYSLTLAFERKHGRMMNYIPGVLRPDSIPAQALQPHPKYKRNVTADPTSPEFLRLLNAQAVISPVGGGADAILAQLLQAMRTNE